MPDPLSRRSALRLGGAAIVAGLAGCQTSSDGTDGDGSGGATAGPTETPGDGADGGADTPTPDSMDGTPTETETPGSDDGDGNGSATDTAPGSADTLAARRVASGFDSPLGLEIPQPGRRFIVDQVGQIHLQEDGSVEEEPFLDVTDRMVEISGLSEQGLLGLAFHPEFDDNGRFFVRYSAPAREGTPDDYSHTFVLSEFSADPSGSTADPDSEQTILEIPEPQGNHNAGAITFGPDGYLYVAVGDGGAANDQGTGHVEDWYEAVDGGNGQDVTENLLGSILRIDVDSEAGDQNYAVPSDNPLVGEDGLDEHYAWGFRNPWRLSFGPDGRLFVGDVGQGAWEEVSIVESGGNYGWNVKEGTHCFRADSCPSESPRGQSLRDPVIEYPHDGAPVSGVSVIGGYLYGGDELSAFDGQYVFADWQAGGQLFAARETDEGLWDTRVVDVEADESFGPGVLSFGRNLDGELFVCTVGRSAGSGAVFRLESA